MKQRIQISAKSQMSSWISVAKVCWKTGKYLPRKSNKLWQNDIWKYKKITKPPSAKFRSMTQPAKKKNDESHIPACLLRRFAIGEQLAPSEQHLQKNMGHFLSIPKGSKPIIIVRFWSFWRFFNSSLIWLSIREDYPPWNVQWTAKSIFLKGKYFR